MSRKHYPQQHQATQHLAADYSSFGQILQPALVLIRWLRRPRKRRLTARVLPRATIVPGQHFWSACRLRLSRAVMLLRGRVACFGLCCLTVVRAHDRARRLLARRQRLNTSLRHLRQTIRATTHGMCHQNAATLEGQCMNRDPADQCCIGLRHLAIAHQSTRKPRSSFRWSLSTVDRTAHQVRCD